MLSPDCNLNLTNTLLPEALVAFSDPNVNVNDAPEWDPGVILSPDVNAQPLLPLPPLPVSAPGHPAPAYVLVQSNQPFNVLASSISVPGAAINMPLIFPLNVTVKFDIVVLLKAKVKYCAPLLPVFKSGPTGRYPLDKSCV